MKKAIVIMALLLTAGCASKPEKINTTYVSPMKYKDYDCEQIIMEMDYVAKRTTELYYILDKKARTDQAQAAVGIILFLPALLALEGGDGPEATEYAQLKGEYEALREAAVQKKCEASTLPSSPEEIIKAEADKDKS